MLRRYARRLASRHPFAGARMSEPARTLEVACFLRYCLLVTTDHLLLMVRRRVAELWRAAGTGLEAATTDWARLYQELVREVTRLAVTPEVDAQRLQVELRRIHRNAIQVGRDFVDPGHLTPPDAGLFAAS